MAEIIVPVVFTDPSLLPTAGAAADISYKLLPSPLLSRHLFFGGNGRIYGNVKKFGDPLSLPLKRRVYLHRQKGGTFVAETWSDAETGAYSFSDIETGIAYYAIAFDYEANYRAVIADGLVPEEMA